MLWAYTTHCLPLWKLVVLNQHTAVIARLPLAVRLQYTYPYPYKSFGGYTTMFVLTSTGWVCQYRKREHDRDRPIKDPKPMSWGAVCGRITMIRAELPFKRYPIDFTFARAEYVSVWQHIRAFWREHDGVMPFSLTDLMSDAIRHAERTYPSPPT